MSNSTITCVYTVPVVGSFSASAIAMRVAAVPLDQALPQELGLRIFSDLTVTGSPVVRTVVLKMGPTTTAAGIVQRVEDAPAGPLVNIALSGAGRDYVQPPILSFADPTGSGATAHALLSVVGTTVTAPGSGYSSATIVTFIGGLLPPGGIPATGHVTIGGGGSITAVVIDSVGGPYVQGPPIPLITDPESLGSGATATSSLGVSAFVLDAPGNNYSSPTLVVTPTFIASNPDTSKQGSTMSNWMTGIIQAAIGTRVQANIPVVT